MVLPVDEPKIPNKSLNTNVALPKRLDFAHVLRLLFRNWILVFGTSFICALIAALLSIFVLVPNYRTSAVVAPQATDARDGILSQVNQSGLAKIFNVGSETDLYRFIEILRSRDLIEELIMEHGLLQELQNKAPLTNDLERARALEKLIGAIRENMLVSIDHNILKVDYEGEDPVRIKNMLDWFISSLERYVSTKSVNQAKNTEDFIKNRIEEAEADLQAVEKAYISLQKKEGVVELPAQIHLSLNTVSMLRTQLIEKEMEIALYKDIMNNTSDIQRLERERQQIREQISKLTSGEKKGQGSNEGDVEVFTPLNAGPQLAMEFAAAERSYLTQVKLLELLKQQYEIARIESKKMEPVFEIIDKPFVPAYPFFPNKKIITLLGFILGCLISSALVLTIDHFRSRLPISVRRVVKVKFAPNKKAKRSQSG